LGNIPGVCADAVSTVFPFDRKLTCFNYAVSDVPDYYQNSVFRQRLHVTFPESICLSQVKMQSFVLIDKAGDDKLVFAANALR
jgi:hypothetical protein